jgi:hypothetical protein
LISNGEADVPELTVEATWDCKEFPSSIKKLLLSLFSILSDPPAVSLPNTPGDVILMLLFLTNPATSNLYEGLEIPIPTFCACEQTTENSIAVIIDTIFMLLFIKKFDIIIY